MKLVDGKYKNIYNGDIVKNVKNGLWSKKLPNVAYDLANDQMIAVDQTEVLTAVCVRDPILGK